MSQSGFEDWPCRKAGPFFLTSRFGNLCVPERGMTRYTCLNVPDRPHP